MPYIIKNGITYAGNAVTVTQAQYDALSEAEKKNGTVYYIYDSDALLDASDVSYDNTSSGISATNVQSAVDSIASDIESLNNGLTPHDRGTVSVTPATGVTVNVVGVKSAGVKYIGISITNTNLSWAKEICTFPSDWCPVGTRPYVAAIDDSNGVPIGSLIINGSGKVYYYGPSTTNTTIASATFI